jgi:hypothetical protein
LRSVEDRREAESAADTREGRTRRLPTGIHLTSFLHIPLSQISDVVGIVMSRHWLAAYDDR